MDMIGCRHLIGYYLTIEIYSVVLLNSLMVRSFVGSKSSRGPPAGDSTSSEWWNQPTSVSHEFPRTPFTLSSQESTNAERIQADS
jgi:hypothetical protein